MAARAAAAEAVRVAVAGAGVAREAAVWAAARAVVVREVSTQTGRRCS